MHHAACQGSHQVGQTQAPGVVQVQNRRDTPAFRHHGIQQRVYRQRIGHSGGVGKRYGIHVLGDIILNKIHNSLLADVAFIDAAKGALNPGAHDHVLCVRLLDHFFYPDQRAVKVHPGIFPAVSVTDG